MYLVCVLEFPSSALHLISKFRNLVAFSTLIIFSIIEMSIAAWITAKYNSRHNFPSSGTRARVRYTLFVSIWTIVIGTAYLIGFLVAASSVFSSVASHFVLYVLSHSTHHLTPFLSLPSTPFFSNQILIWNVTYSLFITWILWLAAAAAITQTLGGALNCHVQDYFVYCGHLNALSGFAWLILYVAVPL